MKHRLFALAFFVSGLLAVAAGPDASEMQDRARGVMMTRAVPLMESALQSETMTAEQARAVALLLQEQRRTMQLFLNYSLLTGQDLQDKLQQVLDVTRSQIDSALQPEPPAK